MGRSSAVRIFSVVSHPRPRPPTHPHPTHPQLVVGEGGAWRQEYWEISGGTRRNMERSRPDWLNFSSVTPRRAPRFSFVFGSFVCPNFPNWALGAVSFYGNTMTLGGMRGNTAYARADRISFNDPPLAVAPREGPWFSALPAVVSDFPPSPIREAAAGARNFG